MPPPSSRSSRVVLVTLACTLVAVASGACGSDPTAPPPPVVPPPVPPAVDLRFKGVGTLTGIPTFVTNLLSGTDRLATNQIGTPLQLSPCAPPSAGGANCSWELVLLAEVVGTPDVNTVYVGSGRLASLDADLVALQRGTFALPGAPGQDATSVVTSLFIDEASGLYATSGLQTRDVRDFALAPGTVAPSGLQAAADQAGARGRVITAVAFRGGSAVYLSYGWTRDTATVYEARTVATPFAGVTAAATGLADAGYVITALGGDAADGYLLVGTRVRGATAARPLRVVTDSIPSPTHEFPAVTLVQAGYAVVGGIFGGPTSAGPQFDLYIGEK